MISAESHGSFQKTETYLKKIQNINLRAILQANAERGKQALIAATPKDSGLAASSWDYIITTSGSGSKITWINNDVENGFPVAIMLQYGYGTGTGGYVEGKDYINPAMKPVFEKIANDVRKAVSSA